MDVISFVRPITALRSITQQTLDAPRQLLQAMSRKLDSLAVAVAARRGSSTPRAAASTLPRRSAPPPSPPAGKTVYRTLRIRAEAPRGPGAIRSGGFIIGGLFSPRPPRLHDGRLLGGPSPAGQDKHAAPRHTDGRAAVAPSTTPHNPGPRTPPSSRGPATPRHRCLADDTTTRLSNQINSVSVNSSKTRSQSRHRVLSAASCVPVIKYLACPRGGGADHPKRTHGGGEGREDEGLRGRGG